MLLVPAVQKVREASRTVHQHLKQNALAATAYDGSQVFMKAYDFNQKRAAPRRSAVLPDALRRTAILFNQMLLDTTFGSATPV